MTFGCILITLRGEAIRLCNVWLLPEKRNAWECLVCFDESAYVVTCNVRSVCFAYVEGPRFSNPHRIPEAGLLFHNFIFSSFFSCGDTVIL